MIKHSFKDILSEEKNKLSHKHSLLLDYKKGENKIYCYVEGPDDPAFYQNFIKNHKTDCETEFNSCGGRSEVLKTYKSIDWNNYSTKRVLFFVDRDLSDFFTEDMVPKKENIYITDGYSIENSIVTDELLIRHLQESGKMPELYGETKKLLKRHFKELKESFCSEMTDVMIWFISLKQNGKQPMWDKLSAKNFVTISKLKIEKKTKDEKIKIFESCTKLKPRPKKSVQIKFLMCRDKTKYIRGKLLIEFLAMFIKDLYENRLKIDFLKNCKMSKKDLSTDVVDIAHRCKCPKSLTKFFENTIDRL